MNYQQIKLFFLIGILIALTTSFKLPEKANQSRNNNVCKKLQGNVLIYLIFTQTKETYNWSEYDIQSTIDSIKIATKWLEERAKENNVELKFSVDYFQSDSSRSVFQKLNGTPKKLITSDEGIDELNKWTDKIVKIATKDKKNKERLIAGLRDQNRVESVSLFFLVNNYFKTDYSLSFNTESEANIEYSVISSKTPAIIAEEILHLFGAPYLFLHPSTNNKKNIKVLEERFPMDVMTQPLKNIRTLSLGDITKYYIGWMESITPEYEKMIREGKPRF